MSNRPILPVPTGTATESSNNTYKNHFERTRMTTRAASWKDTFWDRFAQFYMAAGIGGIAGGCLTAWQLGKGVPDLAGISRAVVAVRNP